MNRTQMGNFDHRKLTKPLLLLFLLQIISTIVYNYFPYEINRRFVLGLLGSNSLAIFISIIILLALVLIAFFFERAEKISAEILLLSAAIISNIFERFAYGGVLDYINFFNINWFNLADLIIVIIVVKILFKLLIEMPKNE